jgi:DNA polymerase I-like protein with 3'-5' exonuclease and polymerase domains
MSLEDEEARLTALAFVDNHVPMALEATAPKPKRVKLDQRARSCRAAYKKALSLAARENRARKAQENRRLKAEQKAADALAAKQLKIDEAADGYCDLPALVLRDGTVRPLDMITALDVVEAYLDELYVDVEHSGYDIGHELYELRTVQLGGEEMAVVFDAADEMQQDIIRWALADAVVLHAFAATADLVPLVKAGLISWDNAWDKMHDIALYAKLIDPKMAGSDANGLKDLAHDMLREYAVSPEAEKKKNELFKAIGCNINTNSETAAEKNGWNMVPKSAVTMIRYAGSDVLDLAAVRRVLPPLPVPDSVLDTERLVQKKCARVALDGFSLDLPHIDAKIEDHEASKDEHRNNVEILTDGKITNPSSPCGATLIELWPHLAGVLDVSTDTGEPSASKKSLEKVQGDGIEAVTAKEIIAYRHDVTTLSLLLRPLQNLCLHGDHRMRPTVYTISADTGRMSCVRPNGQQFSRRGGIRACVCADPGMVGISADFQGCEIKVAAGLSGDRGLLEADVSTMCHACKCDPCQCGKNHLGLHWLAAHLTFEKYGEVTKEHRYKAKAVIFRKLFGGAPDSLVAQQIADTFDYQIAPEYKAWDDWLRKSYAQGKLIYRDYSGHGENFSQDISRKRYAIYRAYSGRQIYCGKGEHAVGNYAIQGTARELLTDGIKYWSCTKWGDYPLLPVHDQLLTWVPKEEAAEASKMLRECMRTDVLSTGDWRVEIDADLDEPFKAWPDSS